MSAIDKDVLGKKKLKLIIENIKSSYSEKIFWVITDSNFSFHKYIILLRQSKPCRFEKSIM